MLPNRVPSNILGDTGVCALPASLVPGLAASLTRRPLRRLHHHHLRTHDLHEQQVHGDRGSGGRQPRADQHAEALPGRQCLLHLRVSEPGGQVAARASARGECTPRSPSALAGLPGETESREPFPGRRAPAWPPPATLAALQVKREGTGQRGRDGPFASSWSAACPLEGDSASVLLTLCANAGAARALPMAGTWCGPAQTPALPLPAPRSWAPRLRGLSLPWPPTGLHPGCAERESHPWPRRGSRRAHGPQQGSPLRSQSTLPRPLSGPPRAGGVAPPRSLPVGHQGLEQTWRSVGASNRVQGWPSRGETGSVGARRGTGRVPTGGLPAGRPGVK